MGRGTGKLTRSVLKRMDEMGTGYATLWNAFKRITAGCSHTEKLALYSDTRSSSTISTEAGGIAEPRYSFPKFVATLCLSPQSRRIPHWLSRRRRARRRSEGPLYRTMGRGTGKLTRSVLKRTEELRGHYRSTWRAR